MTRLARIAHARYMRRRYPMIRVRVLYHGCETPMANLLRTSFGEPGLTYFFGEPIPLGEKLRGVRRYFGVME